MSLNLAVSDASWDETGEGAALIWAPASAIQAASLVCIITGPHSHSQMPYGYGGALGTRGSQRWRENVEHLRQR
jgi:hypothetical protein